MKAYIISFGDELVKGEICNTNAVYISQALTNMGINVSAILNLPDDIPVAEKHAGDILENNGIFIFTGGLGATRDDISRKIISRALNIEFVYYGEGIEKLKKWYSDRGREFRDSDESQALIPRGSLPLENDVGLAYGFYLENGEKFIFSLPGVPAEMKSMFDSSVVPIIKNRGLSDDRYRVEFLIFTDIAEYTLDSRISKIIAGYPGIKYGTRSNNGIIRVRLETLNGNLKPCMEEIKEKLKDYLVSVGNLSLEEVAGKLLKEKGLTLSTAESCTAGYLSKTITNISGSSDYFLGGVVSYSNTAKENLLGVSGKTLERYGAVSHQTAKEMAAGVMRRFDTDIGISITGIAGPTGGTPEKPVGTVFIGYGLKGHKILESIENHFKGDRETVRLRSVNKALSVLIRLVKKI